MVGAPALSLYSYSASMNSYRSLTAAPGRSTPPLFSGTRFPFPTRGFGARVPSTGPARRAPTPARRRRASPDTPSPNSPTSFPQPRARGQPEQSAETHQSPSWLLLPETPVKTSDTSQASTPLLSEMDPIGSTVRQREGTPQGKPVGCVRAYNARCSL